MPLAPDGWLMSRRAVGRSRIELRHWVEVNDQGVIVMVPKTNAERDDSHSEQAERSQAASEEQYRIGVAVRELEDVLATASWKRDQAWKEAVHDALLAVQRVLRATRQSANAEDSLLSQVAKEAPRLEPRTRRVRDEYAELERVIGSLCDQLGTQSEVEDVRQRLRWMISALRRVETKETELLYEAFLVDIGDGD